MLAARRALKPILVLPCRQNSRVGSDRLQRVPHARSRKNPTRVDEEPRPGLLQITESSQNHPDFEPTARARDTEVESADSIPTTALCGHRRNRRKRLFLTPLKSRWRVSVRAKES